MKPKARFIKSIVTTAQAEAVEMPWTRGARRAAMIARRTEQSPRAVRSA